MKKYLLFLPCLLVMFSACNKTEKFLLKDEGAWNIVEKSTLRYENGELQSEHTEFDQGYFQFEPDGTGLMEMLSVWGSTPHAIDWTYNEETNILNVVIPAADEFYDFEIVESSKKSQTLLWSGEVENSGLLQRTELKLKLDKQE